MDDHLEHATEVTRVLTDAVMILELKKCGFRTDIVKYLGHIFRPEQLSIDEVRVKSLKVAKDPRTQAGLRSFVCLCNTYQRFVPHLTEIATLLHKLLCR